jgi:hypothetical protein
MGDIPLAPDVSVPAGPSVAKQWRDAAGTPLVAVAMVSFETARETKAIAGEMHFPRVGGLEAEVLEVVRREEIGTPGHRAGFET